MLADDIIFVEIGCVSGCNSLIASTYDYESIRYSGLVQLGSPSRWREFAR